MRSLRLRPIALAAVGILALALALGSPSGGGLDGRGPGGLLALRRLLESTGHEVSVADVPDGDAAFFVTFDLREDDETDALLDWTSAGGRLIVADPTSAILRHAGIGVAGSLGGAERRGLPARCVAPHSAAAPRLYVMGTGSALMSAPGGLPCYHAAGGAYLITRPVGAGILVAIGGTSAISNELLGDGDNAAFAITLFGDQRRVVFASPGPPGRRPSGLWEALPNRGRVMVILLVAAAFAFALARGRRLGNAVEEIPVAAIPASELSAATARLYRTARAGAFAGSVLRRAARRRIAHRLGLPSGDPLGELPSLLERAGAADRALAGRVLDGEDPAGDDDLIRLGKEIEELRQRVEGAAP